MNLAANAGCTIGLDFTPTALGLRAAALTVTDAGGDTLSIIVEGNGKNLALGPPVPPACAQQPPIDNAFPFCQEAVGRVGPGVTFSLTAGAAESGVACVFRAIPGLSIGICRRRFHNREHNLHGRASGIRELRHQRLVHANDRGIAFRRADSDGLERRYHNDLRLGKHDQRRSGRDAR